MKWYLLFVTVILTIPAFSQDAQTAQEKEAAYTRTINARAQKIVDAMHLNDASKSERLVQIIAGQYRALNEIHTYAPDSLKSAKLAELHKQYLLKLSTELNANQIDQVKDGMTYGVLPLTYNGYLDMLPNLTEEQKKQIMTWLIEAREFAMDAESSEKKHGWFGKYKGRINNYLSAAGYDLKKEGEEWQKRIKAREEAKKKQ